MSPPVIKIKVLPKATVKGKMDVRFPAQVSGSAFLTVVNANGNLTLGVDYTLLTPGPVSDAATAYFAVLDQTAGIYRYVSIASALTSGLDPDLQAIAALTGSGMLVRTGTNTWALRTITAGAMIGVTNGDGVSGNPTIAVTDAELVALGGLTSAADKLPYFTGSGTASLADFTTFARTLVDDTTQGAMQTTLGLVPGTNVQAFDSDLAALAANAGTGLWAVTGSGTGSVRTITGPAAGITVTNGGGVAGNPTLALANDLAALEGLGSTGIAVRTTTDTWAQRTLQPPAAGITITNPAGIAGDPTLVLANDLGALEALSGTNNIYYRSAVDTWTSVTIGSGLTFTSGTLAATGGGGSSTPSQPQGRLTLATGTPVMTSTQSAKTTLYYTPYVGNQCPIYDGATMTMTTFPELSIATTDTTKNPAAIGASKVNDWFVWNDSGTIRLTHGPDWTNDTTRSAGTALTMVNGINLNNASITNGPAASRGTYVGTTISNASSQLDYIFGAAGTTPTAGWLGVWNAYNRVMTRSVTTDTTASWTYTTNTWRQARAQATMMCTFIIGLSEDVVTGEYLINASNSGADAYSSMGLDSTTSASATVCDIQTGNVTPGISKYTGYPGIGKHYLAPIEATFSGTSTFRGGNNSSPDGNDSGFITMIRN